MTRLHRYLVALLLAFVTSVAHAAPPVARCIDEAEACCDEPCDCASSEDACGDDCTGCFCCPVRTAAPAPELPHATVGEVVEQVPLLHAEPALAGLGRDIFQPPRA